ncbi:MAG: hypothetical protein JXR76_21050 [Deltaproteobacteria bacterium]|nr:hypothetical protein [Deltaproteobacteria bacterium]
MGNMRYTRAFFWGGWLSLALMVACNSPKSPVSHTSDASVNVPVVVIENGKRMMHSQKDAVAKGYTIIDLSDNWAPFLFSARDANSDRPISNHVKSMVTRLAKGEALMSPTMAEAKRQSGNRAATRQRVVENAFLEVYGISPGLTVLKDRIDTEVKNHCIDGVLFDRIRRFKGTITYHNNRQARLLSQSGSVAASRLGAEMNRLGTTSPTRVDGNWQAALAYEALVEIQKQLVCEGLLHKGQYVNGGFDQITHEAVAQFENKNRIMGFGQLSGETLAFFKKSPMERLHLAFVRALTERVVDAAAIIETELAQQLTGAVLAEMGISTPKDTVRFLQSVGDNNGFDACLVGVRLPALPAYYRKPLELSVEIHRGDVWYDPPVTADGVSVPQPRKVKPRLTLYTRWQGTRVPLISIPTTIGGWQKEMTSDGKEILAYKNSHPGNQIWRTIVAGPVWIPPPSTPTGEIVKDVRVAGRAIRVVDYDRIGPWYASAYGLVAAFHEISSGGKKNMETGIRTHGTFDYNAIMNRYSHGCHRLPNHLAIRLFSFILRHSPHKRLGHIRKKAAVSFTQQERDYTIKLDDRGYTYELLKPIPVTILPGTIMGENRSPLTTAIPQPALGMSL